MASLRSALIFAIAAVAVQSDFGLGADLTIPNLLPGINNIISATDKTVDGLLNGATSTATTAIGDVGSLVSATGKTVVSAVDTTVGGVNSILSTVGNALVNPFTVITRVLSAAIAQGLISVEDAAKVAEALLGEGIQLGKTTTSNVTTLLQDVLTKIANAGVITLDTVKALTALIPTVGLNTSAAINIDIPGAEIALAA